MKSVKLTLTKLGIGACERMFKPGIETIELPGIGEMKVVTILTHEDESIDLTKLEAELHPTSSHGWIKQCIMWGVKLWQEILPDSKEGETVMELIVRTLIALGTEHVPCNFILMRSHVRDEGAVQHRSDCYYNYHIAQPQQELIATAVQNAKIAGQFPDHALMLIHGALS